VPEIDLKTLERSSPIIGVARELGLKIRGNVGRCFRSERHREESEAPTLFFNAAKNSFFCKVCPDVGNSVIDLVSQSQDWDREKAMDWLAHRSEFDQLTRQLYHGKGKKKP